MFCSLLSIDLCQEYVKNPNSITLLISDASQDVSNSESIRFFKEQSQQNSDVKFYNTIPVFTKADKIEGKRPDITDCLSGDSKLFPQDGCHDSRLVISTLENQDRANKDVNNENLHVKMKQFETFKDQIGIQRLSEYLSTILISRVAKCLDKARNDIKVILADNKKKLNSLAEKLKNKPTFHNLMHDVIEEFRKAIKILIRVVIKYTRVGYHVSILSFIR